MTDDIVLKTGIIKSYVNDRGYGFITNEDGTGKSYATDIKLI